jgi:hypothetical protein
MPAMQATDHYSADRDERSQDRDQSRVKGPIGQVIRAFQYGCNRLFVNELERKFAYTKINYST